MDDNLKRILLIDNNDDDYLIIHALLSQWFELNRIKTYQAALAAITGCQYDLYLIENDLGGRSGLELLAEARQHGCRAPLILLTKDMDRAVDLTTTGPLDCLFEVTPKPVDVGDQAGGWLLVIRDVAAERATQQRIQQQEQLAAIGQLAAGIAHDFNNILTSIIGYAELMQLEPELPDPARRDLERIATQGHRAARLVRQILDFSRQSINELRSLDRTLDLRHRHRDTSRKPSPHFRTFFYHQ